MPGSQPDRTVLVTGGTGGLGAAVTRDLLAHGWRVVVPWVAERELERAPAHQRLELVRADLFDESAVEQAVERAAGSPEAPLTGVVNLVGGFDAGPRVHECDADAFEHLLRLNLRPTFLVTAAAVRRMLGREGPDRGSIVCVSARAAMQPFAGASAYVTAKGAVLAFVRAVAADYRQDGIRCNAVLPSVIDTPANRAATPDADFSSWVAPAEIAGVIRFLLGPDSAPTSGAGLPVYGRA